MYSELFKRICAVTGLKDFKTLAYENIFQNNTVNLLIVDDKNFLFPAIPFISNLYLHVYSYTRCTAA